MGKIHRLSDNLINLIAAGEVVERPASVVKELVENSIDAKSTKIVVRLREGGSELIEVSDNGSGMDGSDAMLALTQHATSKISSVEDLSAISSLGFRGEALASISSVAEVELDTKPENGEPTKIYAAHSAIQHQGSAKSTRGTTIKVSSLFSGIPARKKFLKGVTTELRYIQDDFQATSLIHPEIHFELHHNDKLVHQLPEAQDVTTRIYDLWGAETATNLYHQSTELNGSKLTAYLGKPDIARQDHRRQFIFVNGRPVSDRVVQRAVADAYRGFIHRDQQPVYFIYLDLPPAEVDVNVHPRKQEVRFHDSGSIYRLIYGLVRSTLTNSTKSDLLSRIAEPAVRNSDQLSELKDDPGPTIDYSQSRVSQGFRAHAAEAISARTSVTQSLSFTKQLLQSAPQPQTISEPYQYFEPIQVFNTYIVYEHEGDVIFIDQHAAAESINYEKILATTDISRSKPKLVPQILEFTSEEKERLLDLTDSLTKVGLEISDFGGDSIQVSATPEALTNFDTKGFLQQILSDQIELGTDVSIKLNQDIETNLEVHNPQLHLLVATLACHGSVRAGQRLSRAEMLQIIKDLAAGSNTYNCPHGRPVSWVLPKYQLEKNFSRII